jgi:hypothetical protein
VVGGGENTSRGLYRVGGITGGGGGTMWLVEGRLLAGAYTEGGAMLVRPRPMCPRPKILGYCIPWTKCPLTNLPLTEPSHP